MAIREGLSDWVKSPEIVLEELKKQETVLSGLKVDITSELIMRIVNIVEVEDTVAINFRRMVELQVLTYISWIESMKNPLKTKENFLRELDVLYLNPESVSKNQIDQFKEALFPDMTNTKIAESLKVGTKNLSDYFESNKWIKGMEECLYDCIKMYIEK